MSDACFRNHRWTSQNPFHEIIPDRQVRVSLCLQTCLYYKCVPIFPDMSKASLFLFPPPFLRLLILTFEFVTLDRLCNFVMC